MSRTKMHVTPIDGGDWRVKRVGAKRADSVFEDKSDAIKRAKAVAKKAELGQVIIHGKDGKILTEHTYGKDPEKYIS